MQSGSLCICSAKSGGLLLHSFQLVTAIDAASSTSLLTKSMQRTKLWYDKVKTFHGGCNPDTQTTCDRHMHCPIN